MSDHPVWVGRTHWRGTRPHPDYPGTWPRAGLLIVVHEGYPIRDDQLEWVPEEARMIFGSELEA